MIELSDLKLWNHENFYADIKTCSLENLILKSSRRGAILHFRLIGNTKEYEMFFQWLNFLQQLGITLYARIVCSESKYRYFGIIK